MYTVFFLSIHVCAKAVGTIWDLGAKFYLITLFFQKDIILFISISVISNIH